MITITHEKAMALDGWQRIERIQYGAVHYTITPLKGQTLWFRTAGGTLWQYRLEDAEGNTLEEAASTEVYVAYFKRQPLKQRFHTAFESASDAPSALADAQSILRDLVASERTSRK